MNIATIKVSGVKAVTNDYPTIPAGIVGATVTFEFTDPAWDGLNKTAVFRGCVTRDVLMTGNIVRIPAETVAQACPFLFVGVYGTDAVDNLVIPTLWLSLGTVRDAADPSGDPGTDPDLPIWAQLQDRVEALESGTPSDPDSPGTPGRPGEDGEDGGYYTPAVTQPSSDIVEFAFSPSKPDMPAVDPVQVKLPSAPDSGGNAEDGFSPIAKVEQTATGAVISITDKDGTTTATITNGKDGKDGVDGQPGKDGADGAPGEKGDKGDKGDPGEPGQKGEQGIQGIPGEKGEKGDTGAPGADGKDYVLTEADKAEMVNAVLSALPTWTGGSY